MKETKIAQVTVLLRMTVLCLASLVSWPMAYAATIHVPSDYPTIQEGIDAASDGDEVVIAVGTYHEEVSLLGKAITLRSTAPDNPEVVATTAILDGSGVLGGGVICTQGVVDGLTLRGLGAGSETSGGPIIRRCVIKQGSASASGSRLEKVGPILTQCLFMDADLIVGARVEVRDCVFQGGELRMRNSIGTEITDCLFIAANDAVPEGPALSVRDSNGCTLKRCKFIQHTREIGFGGAAEVYESDGIQFVDCSFVNNSVMIWDEGDPDGYGGGAMRIFRSKASLIRCQFIGNNVQVQEDPGTTDKGNGYGGALNINDSSLTIEECLFSGNVAHALGVPGTTLPATTDSFGGAISVSGGRVKIFRSRFTGNRATSDVAGRGGALAILSGGTHVLSECDFTGNSSSTEGGGIWVAPLAPLNSVWMSRSSLNANLPQDIAGSYTDGTNNVLGANGPPFFVPQPPCYTEEELRNLHVGTPLIEVDSASNQVNATIGLQVNDTLAPEGWRSLGQTTFTDSVTNKAFYRVFLDDVPEEP